MISNTPLLKGTQRQKLLEGKIQERRILLEDLPYFDEVFRVINALNGL